MGEYFEADGVRTYYTRRGDGSPLVLLHGGLSHGRHMVGMLPVGENRCVYLPDRRGQGRTPDVAGPITYRAMANDLVAFIERVCAGPADLVGWSDGGIVGLLVALHRPELVRKLVLIGAYSHLEGCPRWVLDWYAELSPEHPSLAVLRNEHAAVSPDGPGSFPIVAARLIDEWRSEPTIGLSELVALAAPTLVLLGDDDVLTPEYAAAMVAAIPDAQLAVIPGCSHMVPLERPDLVNRLVREFVDDVHVRKRWPPS